MACSLLLSTLTSSDHNYNAALRLYGPPAMFQDELKLPSKPHNARTESNDENLHRLGYDLTGDGNEELSAVAGYCVSMTCPIQDCLFRWIFTMWNKCLLQESQIPTKDMYKIYFSAFELILDDSAFKQATVKWIKQLELSVNSWAIFQSYRHNCCKAKME